jgi:hypothetical protein
MAAARLSAENADVPRTRNSVIPSSTTGADGSSASKSALRVWLSSAARTPAGFSPAGTISPPKTIAATANSKPLRDGGVTAQSLAHRAPERMPSPDRPGNDMVPRVAEGRTP